MSNMKIKFWHDYASGETTDVPARESSLAVGTLSTTFYLAATDAQSLLDAMWAKGMRPSVANVKWFDQPKELLR